MYLHKYNSINLPIITTVNVLLNVYKQSNISVITHSKLKLST